MQEVVRHGGCLTRTLSDKTQPNEQRNCRTVSLSNTFRVEHFPPSLFNEVLSLNCQNIVVFLMFGCDD